MVDNKTFEWAHQELCQKQFTPARIVEAAKEEFAKSSEGELCSKTLDVTELSPDDVIVDFCKLHYGKKDANPLDTIKFYSKRSPNGETQNAKIITVWNGVLNLQSLFLSIISS